MTASVYRRPASKPAVRVTPQLEAQILYALRTHSQHTVARELCISQTTVSSVARRNREARGGAHD